jgi:hypothetical protein
LGLIYPGAQWFDFSFTLLCFTESNQTTLLSSYYTNCWIDVYTNDINLNQSIIIFPNPANDRINIENNEASTLEIINMQGQIVDTKSLTEKVNNLDLSNLVSGVYTLRIKTDRGIAIRKLIKQ